MLRNTQFHPTDWIAGKLYDRLWKNDQDFLSKSGLSEEIASHLWNEPFRNLVTSLCVIIEEIDFYE